MQEYLSLDEEVRDGFLVSSKRKKIWNVELDLLFKLDEVCKKLGLRYYLDWGTLLGAVRHHGFIPWDDDVDVVMLREDYDKLIKNGGSEFSGNYELQSINSDPSYPGLHAKIRYTNSTAILKSWIFPDINQGIFLDIFPLDGVPDDEQKKDQLFKENAFLCNAVKSYYSYDHILSLDPRIIRKLKQRRKIAKSIIKNQKEYAATFNRVEDNFRQYLPSSCNCVGSLMFSLYLNRIYVMDRGFYDDVIYLDFEGYKFPCPCKPHEVLDVIIGKDHMVPKQCPSNHGAVYFDPDRPYTDYLERLRADYSFIKRANRAIVGKITGDTLSELEHELIKL